MNYSELLQLAKGWGNFISGRIIIWRLPNMTQSKKEDLIVALFAYVQGLTTLATMENVHYAYKWEDKLTDLIGIFSCEF